VASLLLRGEAVVSPRPAAFTDTAPFARGVREWTTADRPGRNPALDTDVLLREVSPRFFDVLQVPLVAGRTLSAGDVASRGVLVNESMASGSGRKRARLQFVSNGDRQVVAS
jgi:hypothetical protein